MHDDDCGIRRNVLGPCFPTMKRGVATLLGIDGRRSNPRRIIRELHRRAITRHRREGVGSSRNSSMPLRWRRSSGGLISVRGTRGNIVHRRIRRRVVRILSNNNSSVNTRRLNGGINNNNALPWRRNSSSTMQKSRSRRSGNNSSSSTRKIRKWLPLPLCRHSSISYSSNNNNVTTTPPRSITKSTRRSRPITLIPPPRLPRLLRPLPVGALALPIVIVQHLPPFLLLPLSFSSSRSVTQ
mmetsp:Transcript_9406/g.21224  ORF Transcript_9406/g.21224 Transcript_9406/m.21224 type:complete len:240 (+) Transcript_9406:2583-3302(+)